MNFFRPPLVRGGRFSSLSSGTPYAFPFPAPFLALNCFRSARPPKFFAAVRYSFSVHAPFFRPTRRRAVPTAAASLHSSVSHIPLAHMYSHFRPRPPVLAARHPVRGILPHPTFLPKITAATVSRSASAFFIRPLHNTHSPSVPQRTAPVPRLFQCCFAPAPSTTVVLCGVVFGSYCRKMPPTPTKNGNSGGKAAEAGFCGKFFALRFFPCYAIIRTRKKDKEKKS